MVLPDFDTYRRAALAEGFDEVAKRRWPAGEVVAEHRHPFAVRALLVQGEMWLGDAQGERHLRAGDGFELAAQAPHTERYGAEGATYWAARRHAPPGRPG